MTADNDLEIYIDQNTITETLKEIYKEYLRIERDMKSLTESKKELKIYAKKKGIDLKALEECFKKIKQPREEVEITEEKVKEYMNILLTEF